MQVTIRIEPRKQGTLAVYAQRKGYSEFYVGEAFTKWGAKRKAMKELTAFEHSTVLTVYG